MELKLSKYKGYQSTFTYTNVTSPKTVKTIEIDFGKKILTGGLGKGKSYDDVYIFFYDEVNGMIENTVKTAPRCFFKKKLLYVGSLYAMYNKQEVLTIITPERVAFCYIAKEDILKESFDVWQVDIDIDTDIDI